MSDSENAPDKMKVAELRAALQERGLDTKGTKPVLVGRLQSALDAEKPPEEETPKEPVEVAEEGKEQDQTTEKEEKMETEDESTEKTESPKKDEATKEGDEKKEEEKKEEKKGVKRKMDEEPFEVKENEPEIPESLVCLDWHNSDLNLRITDDFTTGIPFSRDGWGYCYAAARATYGFTSGKVWYEIKYLDNIDVKVEKETTTYDLRVGWSTDCSNLMLGEDEKSWCYSSAEGKMAHNRIFEEYGEKFEKGDIIGAFIDFTQDEINVTFSKNGEDQGDAFQIAKADLDGKALFPHIMSRNVKFEMNFGTDKEGSTKESWKDALDGDYVKVGSVEENERTRGSPRIQSREECEMIMMIGLPGSGKTTWVNKHVSENSGKQYNVISTTTMIEKMTVNGEPRKKHHKGKWEQVVQKATRSLQEMLRAASQRRRNVIIDQTNVYPNAQKRKARPFEGFQRRSVVVVPTDEIYKERCAAQESAGCKDIPDDAIMEMKANFTLPEEDADTLVPIFVETSYVELDKEKAKEVVDLYNKIAKEKGFGKKHEERKNKKFRGHNRGNARARGSGSFAPRGNRPTRGNFRGNVQRGGRVPPFARGGNMRGNMRGGNNGPWMRGRGNMGPRGGMMGGPGMGPSPWSQNGNMNGGGGGGMGPQGWGPWNQGGGMGNMGGNMNGMGGNMNGMGGNMGGNMGGMGNNMRGNMGNMGGGMNMGMGGGMGGNMGGNMGNNMGGGGNTWSNNSGGMQQQRQGNMGGGGNMGGNKWGGNQGNNFGNNHGGYRQGYPGSQKWGGNQRGNNRGMGGMRGRKY